MTMTLFVLAAACGGALRFVVEFKYPPVGPSAFPRATLVVNLVGSFVLGIVSVLNGDIKVILGAGLCGALTTFSGVSLQLHRRIIAGAWRSALIYFATTIIGGISLALLGIEVGKFIL